jgi:carbonic anhydrase
MNDYNRLLLENKSWSQERLEQDPEYFNKLARVQTPKFLWIGCADSRVPPNEITGTKPGEIFIHRNVANLVVNTDLNMLSALQYAVEVLKVDHVIVCGHYGCGGVKAAMSNDSFGLINKWLRNIKDVYRLHREDVNAIKNEADRVNKLVEFNVIEQLQNLSKTTIIQKSWKRRKSPELHGWVFGLNDGLIKELINIKPGAEIDPIYRYDHFEDED